MTHKILQKNNYIYDVLTNRMYNFPTEHTRSKDFITYISRLDIVLCVLHVSEYLSSHEKKRKKCPWDHSLHWKTVIQ